jgi:hypothetical protein
MFKIQFRVEKKMYNTQMYCEIIDTSVILWNIEKNKYVLGVKVSYTKIELKYKNIFNYGIYPVNYSGKILSCDEDKYNMRITPLLNGKLHGYNYYFIDKQLYEIHKYRKDKLNTIFDLCEYKYNILYVNKYLSQRSFYFTKNSKLKIIKNNLKTIEFRLWLNDKIETYLNYRKNKKFVFTENGEIEMIINNLQRTVSEFYQYGKIKTYCNPKLKQFNEFNEFKNLNLKN